MFSLNCCRTAAPCTPGFRQGGTGTSHDRTEGLAMDRIEQLMKAAKPRPAAPNKVAAGDTAQALAAFGETEVIRPARAPERGNRRGRTAVRTTAATVLAAAAV